MNSSGGPGSIVVGEVLTSVGSSVTAEEQESKYSVKQGGYRLFSALPTLLRKREISHIIQQHAVRFKRSETPDDKGKMCELFSLRQSFYSSDLLSSEMMKPKVLKPP